MSVLRNFFARSESGGSFLPQDYVARKAELRANVLCLGLFGVVMFGVIAAFFVTNRQWIQVRTAQQAITVQYTQEAAKIEQLNRLEGQKAEMMEKAEITTALIEKVPRSTLLSELITRMPQEITVLELTLVSKRIKDVPGSTAPAIKGVLTTMNSGPAIRTLSSNPGAPGKPTSAAFENKPPEPEKIPPPKFEYTLHIVGVARQNNNVADYLASLKDCPFLENVDLKYCNGVTIEKLDLRKFQIDANIRKDADARGIEPARDLNAAAGVPGSSPVRDTTQSSANGGKEQ